MFRAIVFFVAFIVCANANAQDTTIHKIMTDTVQGTINIVKDGRLDILAAKQLEINKTIAKTGKGYRLMVLNSNDQAFAMKVRQQLLQNFPDQKVYMSFQAPFIKIKFGNFIEKADAEKYKKIILAARIVTTNVYLVPEIIEIKPDKNKDDN